MKQNPGSEVDSPKQHSRRDFIRKAAWVSPVLLTLPAAPSFAQQGSAGAPGTGDPGTGDPGTGPTPINELNCDEPLQPIDSDIATNMCELSFDADTGDLFFQDVIVDQNAVPGRISQGDVLGTCDSFLCNAS